MAIRIAINGFGRIGRTVARVALIRPEIEIVAVNDLADPELLANLLRFDSVHGRLAEPVGVLDGKLGIGERTIPVLSEKNPADLPWSDLNVDVVVESTGVFTDGKAAAAHLSAGARRVLISAPATNVDFTVVVRGDGDRAADHVAARAGDCGDQRWPRETSEPGHRAPARRARRAGHRRDGCASSGWDGAPPHEWRAGRSARA
ncbi:glyceraldehyde 3-phosphate dehydrogenase NAD-binding domain-containing protein [Streptomyces sp. NPDC003688]